jgi:hypothetical protein
MSTCSWGKNGNETPRESRHLPSEAVSGGVAVPHSNSRERD